MFALLEHTTPDGIHWDLLVEQPGADRLATWRLRANPIERDACLAEPIGDHRRIYLEFEGDIGGGRGVVRHLDRGPATIVTGPDGTIRLRLGGAVLRGDFDLIGTAAGLEFRPAEPRM